MGRPALDRAMGDNLNLNLICQDTMSTSRRPKSIPRSPGSTYCSLVRYELLRSKLDFPPEDIIFDCLLLKVGIEEHRYPGLGNSSPLDSHEKS